MAKGVPGKRDLGVPIWCFAGAAFADCDEPAAGTSWVAGAVVVEPDMLADGLPVGPLFPGRAGEGGSRGF